MSGVLLGLFLVLGCQPAPVDEGPILVPGTPGKPVPKVAGPCADNCQLLLEHDYRKLEDGGFCEVCKGQVGDACDRTWPAEGGLKCGEADYLRNCMYARLGYTFEKAPEWREVFDKEGWYAPDEGFQWSSVSPLQAKNAGVLKKMVDDRACAP